MRSFNKICLFFGKIGISFFNFFHRLQQRKQKENVKLKPNFIKNNSVICIHIYSSLNSDFIAFEFHRISQRIRVLCKKFTIQNRIFCKSLAYVQLSFDLSSKLMFTLTELMYMVSGAIMSEKERVCVHKHHESL